MKVAYLHGFGNRGPGKKNTWLHKNFKGVYDPQIDYTEKSIYMNILLDIKKFNPDFIIGSSMGGYFAYNIAKQLDIPALLFNPAIHTRSYQPDMTGMQEFHELPKMTFILGIRDAVINPIKTMKLVKHLANAPEVIVKGHKHRISYDLFTKSINDFKNKIKQ
jgi:hypothetical protein